MFCETNRFLQKARRPPYSLKSVLFRNKEDAQTENSSLLQQEAEEPQTNTTQDTVALQNNATMWDIVEERIAQSTIAIDVVVVVFGINIITSFLLALAFTNLAKFSKIKLTKLSATLLYKMTFGIFLKKSNANDIDICKIEAAINLAEYIITITRALFIVLMLTNYLPINLCFRHS